MEERVEQKTEVFERVLKLATVFSEAEIAEALNISKTAAHRIVAIDKYAKAGAVEDILKRDFSQAMKEWVVKKYGIDLTPPKKKEAPVEPKPVVADQTADDKNIAALIAAVSRINGNLVNLAAQIEAVGNLLRDSINANADIIYGEVASHKDILNGIKANTRRRYEGKDNG